MMTFEEFKAFATKAFPEMSDTQIERFRLLEDGYKEWNAKINVISRKDIDSLYDHHVLHSLAIGKYLYENRPAAFEALSGGTGSRMRVLDLGTGGGFPGIPLAILFPGADFTLCDSIGKKTIVAKEIASLVGLENVNVVNARAESLPGTFDFVVSRAVASLRDFYPWVKGKFKSDVLFLKGGDIEAEIMEMAARYNYRRARIDTWPVNDWLRDDYFSGKFVIDIMK